MIVLYSTLLILNIVLVLLRKNSKIGLLITIVGQAILMCGNNMNSDFSGYQHLYNQQEYSGSMEMGYVYLSKLAYSLGLDYQIFVAVILLVAVILMYVVIYILSDNIHLVALLYLSTMMFIDVVQVRQYVAYIIMVIALLFHSRRKKILFCLSILFGSLFQITILIYMPLVFLNAEGVSSKRKTGFFFVGILILVFILTISGSELDVIGSLMSHVIQADKMVYFQTRARYGYFKYYIFQFVCVYIIWIIQRYYFNKNIENKKRNFVNSTYICVLYSSIAMPLLLLNNNFYRFFKFGLIPLFICLSYLISDIRTDNSYCSTSIPLTNTKNGSKSFFGVICVFLISTFTIMMQASSVVIDVLNNNVFLP